MQNILNLEITRTYPNSLTTSQFEVTYELSTGYSDADENKPYQWSYNSKKTLSEGKPEVITPFDITNEQFKKDIVGVMVSAMSGSNYTGSLKESDIKSVDVDKSSFYTDETGTNTNFKAKLEFADGFKPVDHAYSEKKVAFKQVQYKFENGKWIRNPGPFRDILFVDRS